MHSLNFVNIHYPYIDVKIPWVNIPPCNTLPLQTAVPGLAVPGAAGARHQHRGAGHHARTAPRKLFNQVEYLIVLICLGLSLSEVHVLCTFCKLINKTFGAEVQILIQFCYAELTALPPAIRR